MRWTVSPLFHYAFYRGFVGAYDTALGCPYEIEDLVAFGTLGESRLDLGACIGDVKSREIQVIVYVLDVPDDFAVKAAAAQSHDVHARETDGIPAAEGERRDVLVDLAAAADHGMLAYVRELVHYATAADDGPVVHVGFAGNAHETHEDTVLADTAVVSHVHV